MTPKTVAVGGRVLVADDQPDVLESLNALLMRKGFGVETVHSPAAVLRAVREREFDAVLMDLNYARDTTSGREGLDLLPQIRDIDDTLPVLVMTAWGSIESAIEAIREGARDYIEKPWDNTRLVATLHNSIELGRALRTSRLLRDENRLLRGEGVPVFLAESPVMQPIKTLIQRVGPSDANVLITGEHGTGKEVVARQLHAMSPRSAGAFVPVNVGGLAEHVRESEMFGHVKGAFTDAKTNRAGFFELADRGTLFLDEIANTPPSLQATLLRALETGEFQRVGSSQPRAADVRLLSATNARLDEEISAGRFREDLLFRLNTVEIQLPPLRERGEDIPLLAGHFLRRYGERYRKKNLVLDSEAMKALLAHPWPGNVRELDHTIERAVLMSEGKTIGASSLGLKHEQGGSRSLEYLTLREIEDHYVHAALRRHGGNVSAAAKSLGISRASLYRRLKEATTSDS